MKPRGVARARAAFGTLAAIGGGVLIIGLALQLLFADRAPATPPYDRIVLSSGTPVRTSAGWVVPAEAQNPTAAAFARIRVRGALYEGDRRVETAEAVVAVLPAGSRQRAPLVFRSDPAGLRLVLTAAGPEVR